MIKENCYDYLRAINTKDLSLKKVKDRKDKSEFSPFHVELIYSGFVREHGENDDKQNGEEQKSSFRDDHQKISAVHVTGDGSAILQEHPSGSGQRSPQQNSGKLQFPKQIPAASLSVGCRVLSFKNREKGLSADEKNRSSHIPINHQDTMENDLIENDLCVKCAKGGILLHCGSRYCSVAVHESCIQSPLTFDDKKGYFVCPSCLCTRSAISYSKAKEKLSQAKKALEDAHDKLSERDFQELPRGGSFYEKGQAILRGNLSWHHKSETKQQSTTIEENQNNNKATGRLDKNNSFGEAETS